MHSKEQMRKREAAIRESVDHHRNATVTGMRDGRDHESHKRDDMARDDKDRGEIAHSGAVGDMGDGDRYSMGY